MPKQKQLSFLKHQAQEMGGAKLKGNPRHKRPFHSKKPLHLILKSSHCKGQFSLLNVRFAKRVQATVYFYAKRFHIKVYRFQNVGNHLHIVLQGPGLKQYSAFVRAVSGRIAQVLLKEMGFDSLGGSSRKAQTGKIKFWDYRPFSRVVGWGKDFAIMKDYILKNTLDVLALNRTPANLQALKATLKSLQAQGPPSKHQLSKENSHFPEQMVLKFN
jgi:hypothetical protein